MCKNNRRLGYYGELLAERYLNSKGYLLIEKNKSYVGSEIDLICKKDGWLVFVEVKYRTNNNFGPIYESIDKRKLRKLRRGILKYLNENCRLFCHWRLDALLIFKGRVEHYEDILMV